MRISLLLLTILFAMSSSAGQPYIVILGVAQDGGYPHAGCKKDCCKAAWTDPTLRKNVVSFALVDSVEKKWWLFEATPDIREQLQLFMNLTKGSYRYLPDGIFITHAHIGHYTGLMQLGREVLNTKTVPVYALPRMCTYLSANGPWSQLVSLQNITLKQLSADTALILNSSISIESFTVPHRDEYSETAGFRIVAGQKTYLFIPDIDKWKKWNKDIIEEVKRSDIALLDATFFSSDELPNRKMEEVPHPLVSETMQLFANEPQQVKAKIHFIHFNHTNPLLWNERTKGNFEKSGFRLAKQGEIL